MTDATLSLNIDASGSRKGAQEHKRAVDSVKQGSREASKSIDELDKSTKKLGFSFEDLKKGAKAAAAALAVREIIQYADGYKQLEGRIKVVTNSQEQFNSVIDGLNRVAQQARAPLDGIAQLYTRISINAGDLIENQKQLLNISEAVATSISITGESAASAQGAMVQFAQALGTNFEAAGQELRSIQEQAPRLAKAIIDGMRETGQIVDTTNVSLKTLKEEGLLDTVRVAEALESQMGRLRGELAQTSKTVGQALTELDNALYRLVGTSNEVRGVTDLLADAISGLAGVIDEYSKIGTAAALTDEQLATRIKALKGETIALTDARGVALLGVESYTQSTAKLVELQGLEEEQQKRLQRAYLDKAEAMGFATEVTKIESDAVDKFVERLRHQVTVAQTSEKQRAGQAAVDKAIALAKKNLIDLTDQEIAQIRKLGEATVKEYSSGEKAIINAAKKQAEFREELLRTVEQQERLKEAADTSKEAYERLNYELDAENEALKEGYKAGTRQFELVKEMIVQRDTLKDKIKETIDAYGDEGKQIEQIFEDVASGIHGAFVDTFEDLFRGQINSFSDFADQIKDVFIKMLAQLAALAVAKPIIVPIVTAVGGGLGLSSSSIGQVTGQLGGGVGLGDLGGVGSLFGGGSDLLSSAFTSIDQFALDTFGIGQTIGSSPFYAGIGDAGTLLEGTGLTSQLANTFSGAWGGTIASFLGLGHKNALVNTGTSLAGAAIGNLLLPGIGGIIGSFAGTALGGLLGGGTPHPASNFGASGFTAGGALIDPILSSKHTGTEQAGALRDLINQTVGGLAAATGIDFSGISSFQGGVDNGTGFFSLGDFKRFDSNTFTFNPEDEADAMRALNEVIVEMVRRVEDGTGAIREDLIPALQNIVIEGRDTAEVISDIAFIANFEKIGDSILKTEQPLTIFQQQMQNLRDEFAAAEDAADRLGLPLDELADKFKQIEDKIRDNFNQSLAEQLLGTQSQIFSDLATENQRYQNQLAEAKEVNGDLALVEAIHAENLRKINDQYSAANDNLAQAADSTESIAENQIRITENLIDTYSRITKTLNDSVFSLQISDSSSLSLSEKLAIAQQRFYSTAAAARGGDTEAASSLPSIANDFIELARQFYASSDQFDVIFANVIDELKAAETYYIDELSVLNSQLQELQTLIELEQQQQTELESQSSTLDDILTSIAAQEKIASLANPALQVSAGNVNEMLIKIVPTLSDAMAQTAIELLKAATPGIAPGGGTRSAFFEANPVANAALISALRAAGVPGFASGGRPFSTLPRMVGENGIEVEAPQAGSSIIPIQNNAAMLNEMRASNQHLQATVRLLQAGLQRLEAQQEQANVQLQRLNTKANRARA